MMLRWKVEWLADAMRRFSALHIGHLTFFLSPRG
jgi:hypothetical protein